MQRCESMSKYISAGCKLTISCLCQVWDLLLFWAHYIEDGSQVVTENKGEDVANYIKKEGHLQM